MPGFFSGLAEGLQASQEQASKQEARKIQTEQLELQRQGLELDKAKFADVHQKFVEDQELKNGMAQAAADSGFTGAMNFLKGKGEFGTAMTLEKMQEELNQSVNATKKSDLDLTVSRQQALGVAANQVLKEATNAAQSGEDPQKVWEQYQPVIKQIWPDAPKKFTPQVEAMLNIAIAQANPKEDQVKHLSATSKLMADLQQAEAAGDTRSAMNIKAVLQKQRMMTNPVTGEMVDLAYSTDPQAASQATFTQSTAVAEQAPPGTPVLAQGNAITPEMQKVQNKIQQDQKAQPGQFSVPTGYRLKNVFNKSEGIEVIPGGPADKETIDNAGRIQMMRTAQAGLNDIKSLLFDPKGNVNWETVASSRNFGVPLVSSLQFSGMPKSKGRDMRQLMEYGIQAITRSETGAAMPESELDNTILRFLPSPLDSNKMVKVKLLMYESFINGSLKLVDTNGRFNAARFDDGLNYIRVGGTFDELATGKVAPKAELESRQKLISDVESLQDEDLINKYQQDPKVGAYVAKFMKANPSATPADAIRYYAHTLKGE